jgi:hypothetical protein
MTTTQQKHCNIDYNESRVRNHPKIQNIYLAELLFCIYVTEFFAVVKTVF